MLIYRSRQHRRSGRSRRGAAIIIALAIVMGLLLIVVSTQHLVVTQLAATRNERDYDRALMMAEAGANAYLNMLANGSASTGVTNYRLIPPVHDFNNDTPAGLPSLITFKSRVKAGTYTVIHYPNTTSQTGYFAGQVGSPDSSGNIKVVAFGWSNGVVRRVQVTASSFDVFDWAAIYGLDPNTGSQDFAVKFGGSASVVGAFGAEGSVTASNNATFYDGPIIWANASYGTPWNNPDPTVSQSSPGVPTGHVGTGTLASPLYRHYTRSLNVLTADQEANQASGSSSGVGYYQTHNNDTTGIRFLFKNNTTNAYLETAQDSGWIPTTGNSAYSISWPAQKDQSAALTAAGITGSAQNNYPFVGLRMYPGDYYVTSLTMSNGGPDMLYLRTYNDSDLAGGTNPLGLPANNNPNSGQAANRNIRLWIGKASSGTDSLTTFGMGTTMEYSVYASRFRVYVSNTKGVELKASSSTTTIFNVNLLTYNKDSSGNGYGTAQIDSGAYLLGSLIGWQITVQGGATVQKQAPEVGPNDRVTYVVNSWKELP